MPILVEDRAAESEDGPDKPPKNNIQDKGPALSEISFAIGSLIGPVLGGGLQDASGYKAAVYTMAVICVIFGALYFLIVIGLDCCVSKKKVRGYDSVSTKSMSFDR